MYRIKIFKYNNDNVNNNKMNDPLSPLTLALFPSLPHQDMKTLARIQSRTKSCKTCQPVKKKVQR